MPQCANKTKAKNDGRIGVSARRVRPIARQGCWVERQGSAAYNVLDRSYLGVKVFVADLLMNRSKSIQSIEEICNALEGQGHPDLAKRISYFASPEDLEEGDVPVTKESAQGFWKFFNAVESDGRRGLTCSSEGWLCGSWYFPDDRGVTLWFLDSQFVMFAATGADGRFVRIAGGEDTGGRETVTEKLVEAGLFYWRPRSPVSKNSQPGTMSPDIAGVGT